MGACCSQTAPPQPSGVEDEDASPRSLADDLDASRPPNALHVHLLRARKLPAVDANVLSKNSSDPFVVLKCCGVTLKSTARHRCLDPEWGETFVLPLDDETETLVLTAPPRRLLW